MYFSDVYLVNVFPRFKNDKVLLGECLSGAYWNDFMAIER